MKAFFVILVSILVSAQAQQKINGVTEIDLVLNGLYNQSWSREELPCFNQTVFLLENAKNYTVWAMMIWNSMQRPAGTFYGTLYSLGSYDQCMQNTFSNNNSGLTTQYCLAEVKLTVEQFEEKNRNVMASSESYLGIKTRNNRDLSKIIWGTCLPAACNPDSVAKILKIIYLVDAITPDEPKILIDHCQVSGIERAYTTGFYIFVAFLIGLITAVLLSLFYVPYADPKSTVTGLLECFNLKRNFLSLTKDSSADDIPILSLIKVILSVAVVITHSFFFTMSGPINNIMSSDEMFLPTDTSSIEHIFTTNIDLAIDIYLTMSAIFYIKGLMKNRRHPIISLLNRYFRLMGTYAVLTFYIVTVSIHTGDGPLWTKLAGREQNASFANWHWSLLMLNNYIGSENINMVVAWYIPCDYQLTIMGTIIYMLWQKDKRFAKWMSILIFILSILTPAVVTYWKRLPGILIFGDIEKMLDLRKNEVFLETYIQSQYRALPYLLGMALGYIMTVYKPIKSHKFISKEVSVIAILTVCLCGFRVSEAAVSWCGNNEVLSTAMHMGCRRLIFGLVLFCSIGMIVYGNFHFIEKISELQIISILSRLAYGIYMTHTIIFQYITFSRRNPHHVTYFSEFVYAVGVWYMCVVVSIMLWLLVEAPISNIFNLITNSWRKPIIIKEESKKYIE